MDTDGQASGEGGEGFEPGGAEPEGGGAEGAEGEGEPAGGQPPQQQGGAPGQDQQPPGRKPTRAERRAEYQRNAELKGALDAMTKQNGELTRQLAEAMNRMTRSVEDARPPREDPFVAKKRDLDARYSKVLARLEKDPSATDDFRELMAEYGKLGAEAEISRQRQSAPTPPNPMAMSLANEFPWLHPEGGDGEAKVMVNGYAAKLARTEKRNMQDKNVLYHTLRQAAAMVAKDLGYPLPASFSAGDNGSNGRDRVSGTSGRGAGGGAGPGDFTGLEGDIEAAATIMYPNLEKGMAVQKWKTTVGKQMAAARK